MDKQYAKIILGTALLSLIVIIPYPAGTVEWSVVPGAVLLNVVFAILHRYTGYIEARDEIMVSQGTFNHDPAENLSSVARWTSLRPKVKAASIIGLVALGIGCAWLTWTHHIVVIAVIAFLVLFTVSLFTLFYSRTTVPAVTLQTRAIRATIGTNHAAVEALLLATSRFDHPACSEAETKLTLILAETEFVDGSREERTALIHLARQLPRLSPACRLAAFGFFERSEATCVLPQLNAYLRQLHRRNDSSELITSAEHCAAVLTKLSAASSQKDTLLRSGQPGNHTATLLRAEQPRQKEEASLNTAPPGKSLND